MLRCLDDRRCRDLVTELAAWQDKISMIVEWGALPPAVTLKWKLVVAAALPPRVRVWFVQLGRRC
jgi:hypothetical protein